MISENSVLNDSKSPQLSSADRLFNIWTKRYLTEVSALVSSYAVKDAVSLKGRQRTIDRLENSLVEDICKLAAIRTKDLYAHHKNLDLQETAELGRYAFQIYPVVLEFYSANAPMPACFQPNSTIFAIPKIHALASLIEPFLSEFQSQDIRAIDWQTRSFLTTEFNLSGKLLLELLSPAEQVLLSAYFDFLEEYVAIPWQRLCMAAADYTPTSPTFKLVERMLPKLSEISMAVYTKGCQRFGGYYNRRGQLNNLGVKHSSLRDLGMFQAYLWLCVLQGNLDAIEQELWVFCDLIYRRIDIPWEMASQGIKLLVTEIMKNLKPDEQNLLTPYTNGLVQAFTEPLI
ncbi:MAG: hypothetical protein AAF579_17555 [Cyanobacteria bacterium P01_C01_bin.118]